VNVRVARQEVRHVFRLPAPAGAGTEIMGLDSGFHYRDGELFCEGVPAQEVAEAYGTPCYLYSAATFRSRYESISRAFRGVDLLVCFSVKSCPNLSILKLLAGCGSGFDVVSGGEIYRALLAGAAPSKMVFAGSGKTRAEVEYALESRIRMLNVESSAELRLVDEVARAMKRTADVAIRVNPDVDAHTHAKITTGKKENKFGIGLQETCRLAEEAAEWDGVNIRGIHFHLGSTIYDTAPYIQALEKTHDLIMCLRNRGLAIDTLDVGGGFCISYTAEPVIGPPDYAQAARPFLEKLGCSVIIEPGRYISGSSALLLSRVIYRKTNEDGKVFLICDAAMNDLVRPTLYDAFHRIWPVVSSKGMPAVMRGDDGDYGSFVTERVDVVGPICESGDYLARDRALPVVQAGELLAVFDAGAYGFAMSSNYNARPRPAEVLVEGERHQLIRQRESYADLVKHEVDFL